MFGGRGDYARVLVFIAHEAADARCVRRSARPHFEGEARNLDWREWGKPQARTRRPRAAKNRGGEAWLFAIGCLKTESGMHDAAAMSSVVVPAKAGTHTPQQIFGGRKKWLCNERSKFPTSTGVMGPCFRRDDAECGAQAGPARDAANNSSNDARVEESNAVIARSAATKQSIDGARHGLLSGACPWACRRQDPGARNDGRKPEQG